MSKIKENTDNRKVHFVNILTDSLELTTEEQIKILNTLASNLNIKPLKVVAKEQNKSYNGLKKYGNPIKISGKYFGISKIDDFDF